MFHPSIPCLELADDGGDTLADRLILIMEESDPICGDEPEFSVLVTTATADLPHFLNTECHQTELVQGNGELLALRKEQDPHA